MSVIKSDLEYISGHWSDLSFDPWEESFAWGHFFNLVAMREGLKYGIQLARRLDDFGAVKWYLSQYDRIQDHLQTFWSVEDGYIKSSIGHVGGVPWKKKNLDSAILIAVLLANSSVSRYDITSLGMSTSLRLTPVSDEVLHTFLALNSSFAKTYPINKDSRSPCFGRYEEDIYDGTGFSLANPWFLTTLAGSEFLYAIIPHILSPEGFNLSHPFFATYTAPPRGLEMQLSPEVLDDFGAVACAVLRDADGRLEWVRKYRLGGGELSEQFSRVDGTQVGAERLTWSFEAFLKAVDRRRGLGEWVEQCY
jgi:glucoamylase